MSLHVYRRLVVREVVGFGERLVSRVDLERDGEAASVWSGGCVRGVGA